MPDPRTFVLDSSVLLLYIAGDSRVEPVVKRIEEGVADGYMIEQCLTELYAKVNEKMGIAFANKVLEGVKNSRIKVIDIDYDLMKNAGIIKSKHKARLSMIAAYLIALARNLAAVVVTSDENIANVSGVRVELLNIKA